MELLPGQRAAHKTSSASQVSGATEPDDFGIAEVNGSAAREREDEEPTGQYWRKMDTMQISKRMRLSESATGEAVKWHNRIMKLLSPQSGGVVLQQGGHMILTAIISNRNNVVEVTVYDLTGREKTHYFPMQCCVSDLVDSIREDGYQDKDIRVFSSSYALTSRCDDDAGAGRRLHTLSTVTIRIRNRTAIRAFTRPCNEMQIAAGFDGSLLEDGDLAMVVRPHCGLYDWDESVRKGTPLAPVVWIDYFGLYRCGVPMCQTMGWEEMVSAVEMIHLTRGFTAIRIGNIQRRWRRWRRDNPIYSDEEDGQPVSDTFDEEANSNTRVTSQEWFSSMQASEPMRQ